MRHIETRIDPVAIDEINISGLPKEADQLIVKAHWNYNTFAILDWRGHSITVSIRELEAALENAANHD